MNPIYRHPPQAQPREFNEKACCTRRQLNWPGKLVAEVERRAQAHRHLEGYRFELAPDEALASGQKA